MTAWRKVQGDVNDTVVITLSGVQTLAGATATANVWRAGGATTALVATITDTTARTVSVALGGATGWLASATSGGWNFEVQVTFADGSILTWPTAVPDSIHVRVDG